MIKQFTNKLKKLLKCLHSVIILNVFPLIHSWKLPIIPVIPLSVKEGIWRVGGTQGLFIEVTYINNIKCKSYNLSLRKQNMSQGYISLHFLI